ncbi:hypothetical protein ACJIZ3_009017 [Penstemon smallii]|uniref:Uncharacterized protein n=1 Tax=Penstemon smallii TaxID=265156 RepID=A0ABD3TCE7_9LAMI
MIRTKSRFLYLYSFTFSNNIAIFFPTLLHLPLIHLLPYSSPPSIDVMIFTVVEDAGN